jgi:hypothetical protein
MWAGEQAWLDDVAEDGGEVASRKLGAKVGAVCCLVEEMGVGIEGHARARVAQDAAHLRDVETDIHDQVAGEGVAQVVETHGCRAVAL